jgi:TusA-related sulfurtransferase
LNNPDKDQRNQDNSEARSGEASQHKGQFLNLKGENSSSALIRCMIVLGEIRPGDVLEVLVSEERVANDLTRLLTEEGHRVIEVGRPGESVWKLDIEKGKN